jgi:hypothetical protein
MLLLAVNFIYAGVYSSTQIDMKNCCHAAVEELSCCSVEPGTISTPSCRFEEQIIVEGLRSCGCIHEYSTLDHSFLTKSNIDFTKSLIEIESEISTSISNSVKSFPSLAKTKYNYKIPIYISVSSYLI